MARDRTSKSIAGRIDIHYHRRLHPLRLARRIATAACVILAIAWWALASVRHRDGRVVLIDDVHNPGHVTRAHASFENDCLACHAGGEGGKGFSRAVTDTACLKCHDGAMHHPNQFVADGTHPLGGVVLAIADAKHPGGTLSASCASCHIEHRGGDALMATNDVFCTGCHADLSYARSASSGVADGVIAFDSASHPAFGRKLPTTRGVDDKPRIVDSTKLRFNHAKHLPMAEIGQSCTSCHVSLDGREMMPVKYETSCVSCHALELFKGGPTVAHASLSLVRAQLASPAGLFANRLAVMSDDERAKALVEEKQVKEGRKTVKKVVAITADEWAAKSTATLSKQATDWLDTADAKAKPGYAAVAAAVAKGNADSAAAEFYAVYGMGYSCTYCHTSNAGVPTAAVSPGVALLDTLPTGLGSQPRRWYPASVFDHRKHREMSCVDCHSGLDLPAIEKIGDERTRTDWLRAAADDSHVLVPNMTWSVATARGEASAVVTKSCVDCHHADTPGDRGAGASCATCHVFHDRGTERASGLIVDSRPKANSLSP